jgi:hypothetical protein
MIKDYDKGNLSLKQEYSISLTVRTAKKNWRYIILCHTDLMKTIYQKIPLQLSKPA